jgi:hypothetical protein
MDIKLKDKNNKDKWYTMPDTWDDLTLGKYMKVMTYLSNKDEEELSHDKIVNLIHSMSDIPKDALYRVSFKDLSKLSTLITMFLKTEPNAKLKHIIEIDNVKYGFHPKLRNISLGEFVDIEHCIKDGINKNLHTLLSVLYRPVTYIKNDKYRIEDYEPSEDRANLFKDRLMVGDFNGASVFFYDLGTQLLNTMSQSLKEKRRMEKQNNPQQ